MPAGTPGLPAPRRIDVREVSSWILQKIFGFSARDPYYADNTPVSIGCSGSVQPPALRVSARARRADLSLRAFAVPCFSLNCDMSLHTGSGHVHRVRLRHPQEIHRRRLLRRGAPGKWQLVSKVVAHTHTQARAVPRRCLTRRPGFPGGRSETQIVPRKRRLREYPTACSRLLWLNVRAIGACDFAHI